MSHGQPLHEWLREECKLLGANSSSQILSRKDFKNRLLARFIASGHSQEEMKYLWRLVNTSYKEYSTALRAAADENLMNQLEIARITPRSSNKPNKSKGNFRTAPSCTPRLSEKSTGYVEHDSGVDIRSSRSIMHGGSTMQGSGQKRPSTAKMLDLEDETKRIHRRIHPHNLKKGSSSMPALVDQLQLLGLQNQLAGSQEGDRSSTDVENAVIFSPAVFRKHSLRVFPQFGLLAGVCLENDKEFTNASDPRLFLNTNIPFSAFICGLQGSGKSHTLATLLENCLIQSSTLGPLQRPHSALVFHFGQYTSRTTFLPCEAAFLAHTHPKYCKVQRVNSVTVLAAPSNYSNLKESYRRLPGVSVRPFKLRSKDLNVKSLMALMSVSQTKITPLYMSQVARILRENATSSANVFDYNAFRGLVQMCPLSRDQKCFLNQRLELLESFLDFDDETPGPGFKAGSISIVDMSCPFIDANIACTLFDIYMDIYLKSEPNVGKVIAVDEAHKYMADTPASKAFTESLLTVIRQQRHIGARVIISTQEPTISSRIIDLCSIFIMHRFSSPEWFNIIRKHVSISEIGKTSPVQLFGRINDLKVGEGLLFAPSAVLSRRDKNKDIQYLLGSNLLKIKMRNRVTWDGGKSAVSVESKTAERQRV